MSLIKRIGLIAVDIVAAVSLVACTTSTSMSYTWEVETGDNIKVELDTSDGYKLSSENPFEIFQNDEVLVSGTFMFADNYEDYVSVVENDSTAVVLGEETKDNITCFLWNYGDEYDCAIKIDGSNTGILLGSMKSEAALRNCLDRITITVEN